MGSKLIWRAVLLSLILLAVQVTLSEAQSFIDIYGGWDSDQNYWYLTDELQYPLEDGDYVMPLWTGPNGEIDPPIRALGSPYNGQPGGDDEEIPHSDVKGTIKFGVFTLTAGTWPAGAEDSLGNQRHPQATDLIYVRVFNDDDLTLATHYGESDLYEIVSEFGEEFYTQLPNDPDGPTTDTEIFGRHFKVVGGIDPTDGQVYPVKDSTATLDDGDLAQLIWAGPDGQINAPDTTRMPGGDDMLIEKWGVGEGVLPQTDTGTFRRFTGSFDDPSHGRPAAGDIIYVRLFNASNRLEATHYGDSPTYTVNYVIGESLSVFFDDQVDCSISFEISAERDLTVIAGLDTTDLSYWPMVDGMGNRLEDGDLVHLVWAGSDDLIDPLDDITGMPTGDDSLLTTWGIGEGLGSGTGRFRYELSTYETHAKGYPAQGDHIYLRSFDNSTIGEDTRATWYGETPTYQVQWEFGEMFYSFPDSAFDDTTRTPWYRGLTIYGGLDASMNQYPLTDSSGAMLDDGDLVQMIWAGPDSAIDPMSATDCMPTGDDSLLATWGVGTGFGSATGLFKGEFQTFAGHKGGFPGQGDYLYLRLFNGSLYTDATHYGESALHKVAHAQDEEFFSFPDAADDAIIPNPCYTSVEWSNPTTSLPTEYALFQNYPNPFNPVTDIQYQIPEAGHVELNIYNVLGQEIYTLVDDQRAAGKYTVRWFGTDEQGREVSAGLYFYQIKAGDFVSVRKMVFLK